MAPQERSRRGSQVITGVQGTRTVDRVQESDEMSCNAHNLVGQNVLESMFDRFTKKLNDHFMPTPSTMYKRFGIKRLKALRAMTFEGTTNPVDAKKWLSLIEKCFGVWSASKKEK
ncbi:uncharacterized protein E6C27_scaffold102G00210 [Cucumis melo var. makuwa]|uniref:Uncharacterized protein n=1 Tax=Cucumis melo var. makuwa TaxID=1194695 RepID=A0A5A7UG91_CUCMM|nr:uncharacterized protein E6C27_scaffold102G00210 [Cucumis melo var. makuwa]